MLFPKISVNQRFPSGPVVIPDGPELEVGTKYSFIVPVVDIEPTLFPPNSVNQRLPSGPEVMPFKPGLLVGTVYIVNVPLVVILPI